MFPPTCFSNPIPLPLAKGKGDGYIREAKPLFNSPFITATPKERDFVPLELPISIFRGFASLCSRLVTQGGLRGVDAPLSKPPPLLVKERGTQVEDSSRGEEVT